MGDLKALTVALQAFRDARDWRQFHSLRNLIVSLNLEAAELLELTQWKSDAEVEAAARKVAAVTAAVERTRSIDDPLELLREVGGSELAAIVGADAADLAFVPNATTGVNTVLRSLAFAPGDELLVTDHEYNACRNVLDFVAARSGAEMREALAATDVDLVVLDVMLPGLDGVSLCRAVRQFSAVPILMLTAKGRDTDVAQGLGVGADGYMTKPFSTRELVERVRGLLATRPALSPT